MLDITGNITRTLRTFIIHNFSGYPRVTIFKLTRELNVL